MFPIPTMPSVLPASSAPMKREVIAPAVQPPPHRLRDAVARERDHLAEGELGDRGRVRARHVRHPDLVLARGVEIDARPVDADTGARHDPEAPAAPPPCARG